MTDPLKAVHKPGKKDSEEVCILGFVGTEGFGPLHAVFCRKGSTKLESDNISQFLVEYPCGKEDS